MCKYVLLFFIISGLTFSSVAQQSPVLKDWPYSVLKKDLWKGYERINFTIGSHQAYLVRPVRPLPGNPWIWRASFPDWHTEMDSLLLNKGFFVAYVSVDDQYGSPQAMQVWDQFYAFLTDRVSLSGKPALEAVSRGALYALGWAKRNPDKVSCIYSETPVYDFKSWPGGKGKGPGDPAAWEQLKQVYQFTEEQALAYRDNPVDQLEGLAAFKVPVLNVVGIHDELAPSAENTDLFVQRYTALGGPAGIEPITEGPQELHGHHFPVKHAARYADFMAYHAFPVKKILPYADYFKTRDGLDHFFNAAAKNKKATVAFLGGSITYNPGWRQYVCAWLKERFPGTDFRFIAAGIPSLGSLPHAFRLQRDVLDSGKVDLMFVEAAVNDHVNGTDSLTQVRDLEGIIRHAKKNNPLMDIVMMSFADPDKTSDYDKGIMPLEIANHERMAGYYHLPSINLAKEVHDKLRNDEFSWNDDFKDLHPAVFGQELYFQTIKRLLVSCFDKADYGHVREVSLPVALNKTSFGNGSYVPVKNAVLGTGWTLQQDWAPADQLATREGFVHVPVLSAAEPGSVLTLPFKGTAIGMAVLSGADAGIVAYSVDDAPFKEKDLFTSWSTMLHLPWYILFEGKLKKGNHVLKIRIADHKNTGSKGNACRIVYFFKNEGSV